MSVIKTAESTVQNEMSVPADESCTERVKCSSGVNFVCGTCSFKMSDITNSDCENERATCDGKSELVKQTVGPRSNQDCADGLSDPKSAEDCNSPEESNDVTSEEVSRRTRRNSKRKRDAVDFCPVCGVTVRYSELASHFAKEVENLSKIHRSLKKIRLEENKGVSTTFVAVKSNRENRHAAKVAKFSARPSNEVLCPVCSMRLTGTQVEINSHVLNCLIVGNSDEEVNVVDTDDEDSFEEYEFADQTRVRAVSLVPGGYRSLYGGSRSRCTQENDEYLNVDDCTLDYGNPQYTELDVIHNVTGSRDEGMEQLRKAVLLDPSAERHALESRKWVNETDKNINPGASCSSDKSTTELNAGPDSSSKEKSENMDHPESSEKENDNHIVSSLKEKIKDLEEQNRSVKCLICLEPYTKPVVSITCWHVHCEECWLMTMGVKKLCPQCNMIVIPSDLRRIYL